MGRWRAQAPAGEEVNVCFLVRVQRKSEKREREEIRKNLGLRRRRVWASKKKS